MNLENFNKEQQQAVTAPSQPVLVLAGAGSGKTSVLTSKITYLVLEKGIEYSSILAITFTNKAAKEMKSRVISALGSLAYQIQISTFHSFGVLIMKENYEHLGYQKNFTILDSVDTLTVIKKILKDMNLDAKDYNPRYIKNMISSAKNELIGPMEYGNYANDELSKTVHEVYIRYQKKLINSNSLDFDDLLVNPIMLFIKHPEILEKYQDRFSNILIDEYQDTNEAQYRLVKMLAKKHRNIFVVGDNDQSIYSFRGSNYKNILNFEKDYKDALIIKLEKNYRSTKNILGAANDVIKNNVERKDKNLWTDNDEGSKIRVHKCENELDEAYYVVSEIRKLMNDGISPKNMAVLYRTNAQSRNIEDAFLKANIHYKVVGSFYFYDRKEIKDLISYLKVIHNPHDDVSLLRVINVPKRGIGNKSIENLITKANDLEKSIYDAIDSGKEYEFKKIIEQLRKKQNELSLTDLIELVLDKSGMRKEYESEGDVNSEIRLENMEEFKSITSSFENTYGITSLEDFLIEISLVADKEEHKNNTDVVTLMTIHSAKGLEFDYVFIVGMEEGVFPHNNSIMENNIEEERRLCYVAMTRAKKKLWILNAQRRMLYGNTSENPSSRFLKEINEKYLDIDEVVKESTKFNMNDNYDMDVTYLPGEHVIHDTYGIGVIVTVKDKILSVAFKSPHGVKTLIKGHKSIRKVEK